MSNTQGAPAPAPKIDAVKVEQDVSWLGARLREPSTYAGLAVLLGLLHFGDVSSWTAAITSIGVGIGGVIAIVLPEGKSAATAAKSAALVLFCCAIMFAVSPAMAQTKKAAVAASTSAKLTATAVQNNPLLLLQQFTENDLNAALADANAQTPPDTAAAACYTALLAVAKTPGVNPLPAGPGVFQALQKARDAKALLASMQSPSGPLAQLNNACAPLVLDAQNTLVALGVTTGLVANPAGAATALAGLPAAVTAFLGLGLLK